jgi:hypothetical protein
VARRGKFTRTWLIKPATCLLAVSGGVALSLAVAQGSSTEVGETTANPVVGVGSPVAPFSTVPGSPSYATPSGVLTSWRFHSSGDASAGSVRLKIFRYIGPGLAFKVLAESSQKTLSPSTSYEFKERIPVSSGDLLGLTATGDAEVAITVPGTPQNQLAQFLGGDISVGQTGTATTTFPNLRPSVAATVEPDADHDGYGDETQDKCPVDATTQGFCRIDLGKLKRDKAKGTAILPVTVPGAGTVSLSGKGVVDQPAANARRAKTATATVKLRVKPAGKAKRKLDRSGKAKVTLVVTYVPAGGPSVIASKRVKLIKTGT